MPELPEVEITKQKLEKHNLIGREISGFWSDWPRGLRIAKSSAAINSDIRSRKILGLRRVGKALFFDLSGAPKKVLGWHFRMSGRLEVTRQKAEGHLGGPATMLAKASFGRGSEKLEIGNRTIHAKVFLDDGREIFFSDPRKFGVIWYGTP